MNRLAWDSTLGCDLSRHPDTIQQIIFAPLETLVLTFRFVAIDYVQRRQGEPTVQQRRKTQQARHALANAISGPQIGAERWRMEHVSYKAWCDLARARGWKDDNDADGLRAHCEPEEAATITLHTSLDAAKAAALATFQRAPDDSAFGAILIFHEVLEGAHDDSGNPVRGCPPTWDSQTTYEITSDSDCLESAS